MTIFLMVLKVIGWVLLVAVLLVLFVAALVLFVPIRYRVRASSDKRIPQLLQSFSLEGRASWLLRLVEASGDFHGTEGSAILRVLWIRRVLYPQDAEEEESPEPGADEPYPPEKRESSGAGAGEPAAMGADEPCPPEESVSVGMGDSGNTGEDEPYPPEERESSGTGAGTRNQGSSAKPAQESMRSEPYPDDEDEGVFARASGTVHRMIRKGKGILEDIGGRRKKVKRVWEDGRNQRAFSHLWREVCYLYRHSHPRKCRIQLSFSAGSPDRTGLLFGIVAMCPSAYEQSWQVEPDFNGEQIYLDGEVFLVGRIRLLHVLAVFLRVFFDSDSRRLKAMMDRLF